MDPDTCLPGDPVSNAAAPARLCGARSSSLPLTGRYFVCTRAQHDAGRHAAEGHTRVLAVWTGDGDLLVWGGAL